VFNFTPQPWAIGIPVNYTPNAQPVPFDVVFNINLSLSGGLVRSYYQQQLNAGRVFAYVTALTDTIQGGTPGGVPSFYQQEGIGLDPNAAAPKLTIVLSPSLPGDTDGNGCVNLSDLSRLLAHFGNASRMTLPDGEW